MKRFKAIGLLFLFVCTAITMSGMGRKRGASRTSQELGAPEGKKSRFWGSDLLNYLTGSEPANAAGVGLVNQGNTCYQNSVLQALVHTEPLYNLLTEKIASYQANQQQDELAVYDELVATLYQALIALKYNDGSVYNPVDFASAVMVKFFEGNSGQQDAQEFLVFLLDYLEKKQVLPSSIVAGRRMFEQSRGVTLLSSFTCCGQCQKSWISQGTESTHQLALGLPADETQVRPVMIQNMLKDFGSGEMLEGVECTQCPEVLNLETQKMECNKTTQVKKLALSISPHMNYLILQVKRFAYDPFTLTPTKDATPVIFNNDAGMLCIEETPFTFEASHSTTTVPQEQVKNIVRDAQSSVVFEHEFKVSAVVVHVGESIASGHYYTVTPTGIYNDSIVTLDGGTAFRQLLSTGVWNDAVGYMYFLERVE